MSLTRKDIRGKAYKAGINLGFQRTATAIATGAKTITDAVAFQDGGAGEGDYVGTAMYRPLAAAANQIRESDVVVSTSLTHLGLAYSGDASVLDYEIVGLLHPDELNECIRLALRRVYYESWSPVSPWTDGDFASSSQTSPFDWTATATGTTVTKSALAVNNQVGKYSLLCTGAGSTKTSSFYPSPGDSFVHGASGRGTTAGQTGKYSLLDVTHSTVIYSKTFTTQGFLHSLHTDVIPPGCYEIQAKLETVSSGAFVWDYLHGHPAGREASRLPMPSWASEKARIADFGPAEYGRSVDTDLFNGSSRRWLAWKEPIDYELLPLADFADPYTVQVNREEGLEDRDFWVHGLRAWSDIDDLITETATTDAPEDYVMAAFYVELAEKLYRKYDDAKWATMKKDNELVLASQRLSRRVSAPRRERTIYVPGGRGGLNGRTSGSAWSPSSLP